MRLLRRTAKLTSLLVLLALGAATALSGLHFHADGVSRAAEPLLAHSRAGTEVAACGATTLACPAVLPESPDPADHARCEVCQALANGLAGGALLAHPPQVAAERPHETAVFPLSEAACVRVVNRFGPGARGPPRAV